MDAQLCGLDCLLSIVFRRNAPLKVGKPYKAARFIAHFDANPIFRAPVLFDLIPSSYMTVGERPDLAPLKRTIRAIIIF